MRLQERGVTSPGPYVFIWTVGFGTWALIFWSLRHRGGPVTFVERQVAHVWGASMLGCSLLFGVEMLLGLPVLALSPVLALFSGMVFFIKAGILSGSFYFPAAALFLTSGLDGPLAPVRADDLRRRLGGLFPGARPQVPPSPCPCGPIRMAFKKKTCGPRLISTGHCGSLLQTQNTHSDACVTPSGGRDLGLSSKERNDVA